MTGSTERTKDFLPSNTPVPFWADMIFVFIWGCVVAYCIVAAFFLGSFWTATILFIGSAVGLLFIRSMIKKFMLEMG